MPRMFFRPLSSLALALILVSCSSLRSPVVPGATPKDHGAIGATEGPAWKDGSLYFTDGKHINRMGPDGKTSVFRHNASNGLLFDKEGRLVACESGLRRVTRTEKDGSITVLADRFEGRHYMGMDLAEGIEPRAGTLNALRFRERRFNSPNDLCMDSKGRVYFTDPRYGSRAGMEIDDGSFDKQSIIQGGAMPNDLTKALSLNPTGDAFDIELDKLSAKTRRWLMSFVQKKQERLVEGVYRLDSPGRVSLVVAGGANGYRMERPNGILISPDGRYLYIADNNNSTHGGSRRLLRYKLDHNGDITSPPKTIFDWKDGRGPDGMKMDSAGRIYVAAGTNKATEFESTRFKAGCYILSPSGRLLDFIPVAPDECCNCAFGGKDGKTLFITSGGHLWSVPLR